MIDAGADRCRAGALRLEGQLGFALKLTIHIAAERLSVVCGRDVIPASERMQLVAKQQRLAVARAGDKRVEAPLAAVDDTELEQESCVRVLCGVGASQREQLAGCRVSLGQ